ncbi:unnamed protein product [Trichobilharzia regenti]|nr:unnamed protein product [Trichobilharzia regenti]
MNGVQDRLMCLLQTCLYSFGRLLENLQFNDIAPYADELLISVPVQGTTSCTTERQRFKTTVISRDGDLVDMRAITESTNLCNQWDDQLSRLYSEALNRTSFIQAGKDEVENRGRHSVKNTVDCCIDKLLEQNKAITNYLLDQNVLDENKLCWITIPELHQAPISAWIRFARQRRIPIGLEYANSTDRALATSSAQTMTMSALKIKVSHFSGMFKL